MKKEIFKNEKIKRFKIDEIREVEDLIIKESPLTLFINGYQFLTLMILQENLRELITGFLAAEGIIKEAADIIEMKFKQQNTIVMVEIKPDFSPNNYKKRTLTSGCGSGTSFLNLKDCAEAETIKSSQKIEALKFTELVRELQANSAYFQKTGGTHTAALAEADQILYQMEDIGRHNAIDKVIGKAKLESIELKDKIILTSGRISSEMAVKVLRQGIPFLVSRSAPTDTAVKTARDRNLTLIAFCRGKRFNIYSGSERIINA